MKRRAPNLTPMDRLEIRAKRKVAREYTLKKLAEFYGVSKGTISNIATGKRYEP
jgi:transcriptional regulator with XRE-family HTH domain